MDFFTHQDRAKQNTVQLVVLLLAGVVSIVALVTALVAGLLFYLTDEIQVLEALLTAGPITVLGISGASLVKSSQLRAGGGAYVAESMGGRPVDFNTLDPGEKQLANVVEEISIASGLPVPALYVLEEEPGINAFAAGWNPDNAAIGVTRGALDRFTRSELQGVIAHEFAHIANGDMRIKTRIIGWVFGIAVLTVLGRMVMRSVFWAPRRSRGGDDNVGAMVGLAIAIGLLVIGAVGTLFARMIQAAVSRQREYLADASAVQYTRDPSSIGQALIKIGALEENKMRSAHAVEAGHLLFSSTFGSALASHPPLNERIKRLLPSWDGDFGGLKPASSVRKPDLAPTYYRGRRAGPIDWTAGVSGLAGPARSASPPAVTSPLEAGFGKFRSLDALGSRSAEDVVGIDGWSMFDGFSEDRIAHARWYLEQIPESTQAHLHTRIGAVSAILGLLVSPDPDKRGDELAKVAHAMDIHPEQLFGSSQLILELHRSLHLPAIDIALHSIRELRFDVKEQMVRTIRAIEAERGGQDLFRWTLRRAVIRHIEDQHEDGRARHDLRLTERADEARAILAVVAHFNSSGADLVQPSYEAALDLAGLADGAPVTPIQELTFDRLDRCLDRLGQLDPAGRRTLVAAASAAVLYDQQTTVEELELVRVLADAVRQPVPLLTPS